MTSKPIFDPSIYLITAPYEPLNEESYFHKIEQALQGGVTLLQLREKHLPSKRMLEIAVKLKELAACYHIPFIVNDRVDIALAAEADGVHVGQDDLPAETVRRLIGPHKLLGVSAETEVQAALAENAGADYLGTGAVFPTATKKDARSVSLKTLSRITRQSRCPVVAIGGITNKTLSDLHDCSISGIAVISAIMSAEDPQAAAASLKAAFQGIYS